MAQLTLKANQRKIMGKETKVLRRQGITPVVLFGHGIESLALQAGTNEVEKILNQAGETRLVFVTVDKETKTRPVLVKEVQRDPLNRKLIHVDFYQVKMDEKIKADVPIFLVGEAAALASKGSSILQELDSLSVESFPDKLPASLHLDVSSLKEAGQTKKVKDIEIDSDITVFNDPNQIVAIVSAARVEEKTEEKAPVAETPVAPTEPEPSK